MATIEIEKRIQELEPQFLQSLSDYLDYLFSLQKNREGKNGKHPKQSAQTPKEIEAPPTLTDAAKEDRLKVLRRFKGIASKPHFPVTKYDVYDQ